MKRRVTDLSPQQAFLGLLFLASGMASAHAEVNFTTRTDFSVPSARDPLAITAGNFFDTPAGLRDVAIIFDGPVDQVVMGQNMGGGVFDFTIRLVEEPMPGPESSVSEPVSIVAIDLNGDGIDDLVGAQAGPKFLAYVSSGGTWIPSDTDAVDGGSGFSVDVVDIADEDGLPDLLIGTISGVRIAGNDGGGEFVRSFNYFPDMASGVMTGLMTDVEAGHFFGVEPMPIKDVVSVDTQQKQLVVWPGDSTVGIDVNVFAKAVMVGGEPATPFEAIRDERNGDQWDDLLVAVEEGYVLYYQGNGDRSQGGFDDPVVYDVAGGLRQAGRMPTRLSTMVLGDVVGADGASAADGIDDLILADSGEAGTSGEGFNWIWIVPGTAMTGPWAFDPDAAYKFAAADLGPVKPRSLVVEDFINADGALDIMVVAFDASRVTLFENANDGTGDFIAARSFSTGLETPRGVAAYGATPDLIVSGLNSSNEGTIATLSNPATGRLIEPSLPAPPPMPTQLAPGRLHVLEAVDAGADDVLCRFGTDHTLWTGAGGSTFVTPVPMDQAGGQMRGAGEVGDLGGSAFDDFAVANPAGAGSFEIWHGDGAGTFTLSQEIPGVFLPATHVTGNFTGGPFDDILVAGKDSPGLGGISVLYLLRHDGTEYVNDLVISIPDEIGPVSPVSVLAPGDFNGDGRLDAAVVMGSGAVAVMLNEGASTFDFGTFFFAIGSGARDGFALDVTESGNLDLVVALPTSVAVAEGLGDGTFSLPTVSLASNIDNRAILGEDLDGDDLPELVVLSLATNDVTVFRNLSTPRFRFNVTKGPLEETEFDWSVLTGADFTMVRGEVGLMWGTRDLSMTNVSCFPLGAVQSYTDMDPLPGPSGPRDSNGFFYLLRCDGGDCSLPTFGDDSEGTVRFAVEPCP